MTIGLELGIEGELGTIARANSDCALRGAFRPDQRLNEDNGLGKVAPACDAADTLAGVGVIILGFHFGGFHYADNGEIGFADRDADGLHETLDVGTGGRMIDETAEGFNDEEFGMGELSLFHNLIDGELTVPGGYEGDSRGIDAHAVKGAFRAYGRAVGAGVDPVAGIGSVAQDGEASLPFEEGMKKPASFAGTGGPSEEVDFIFGEKAIYEWWHVPPGRKPAGSSSARRLLPPAGTYLSTIACLNYFVNNWKKDLTSAWRCGKKGPCTGAKLSRGFSLEWGEL